MLKLESQNTKFIFKYLQIPTYITYIHTPKTIQLTKQFTQA